MIVNASYKQTRYNVTKSVGRKIEYIVVHNTGTTASAANNCKYFGAQNRNASADYFIDTDGTIYQFNGDIPNYYSWHCGDGKGKYGITNKNSIGIEVVSAGTEFTSSQLFALTELVETLMHSFGVSATNVVRHYDASRKSCPAYYVNDEKWKVLHKHITEDVVVHTCDEPIPSSFKVKIICDGLNIRKGPGTSYGVVGVVSKNYVYTIVETKGSWGKLKSGAGWISIADKYVKRV